MTLCLRNLAARSMRITISFGLLLSATLAVWSQQDEHPSNLRDTDLRSIERLEDDWNRMNEVSDVEGKGRLLASDSYHVGPSGRLYNKRQDIEDTRLAYDRKQADKSITKFSVENRRIRLNGNVAVVTATGRSSVTRDGQERRGNPFRVVHVWEKREGQWFLIVDQVTAVR